MFGWFRATAIDKVASWLYQSDTAYARGFSEEAFAAISIGSDRQEVLKRLGEPLSKRMAFDGREYWYYSRPGINHQNYWNFIVIVDAKGGHVIERFHEFYTD
jgi:outer membrane protein assembly factor BamE (lipoprotein component of BamABCDE complex)